MIELLPVVAMVSPSALACNFHRIAFQLSPYVDSFVAEIVAILLCAANVAAVADCVCVIAVAAGVVVIVAGVELQTGDLDEVANCFSAKLFAVKEV